MKLTACLALGITLLGCGDAAGTSGTAGSSSGTGTGTGAAGAGGSSMTFGTSSTGGSGASSPDDVFVFSNTIDHLLSVNPVTYAILDVGEFNCIGGLNGGSQAGMTDIAIDRDGEMFGVGLSTDATPSLFTIDSATAQCSVVGTTDTLLMGLSFVPLESGAEGLFGYDVDGGYYSVDRLTGVSSLVGSLPAGTSIKGADTVSIVGDRTYLFGGQEAQNLIVLNPETGELVEDLGVVPGVNSEDGWGLGYWGGRLFSFSYAGQIKIVEPETLETTVVATTEFEFRGAGVTTVAPLVVPE